MAKFPSIPLKGTDKNSKLFLDMLAGRMGFDNTVVTLGDLYRMGYITLPAGLRPENIPPEIDPGSIVKPSVPAENRGVEHPTVPENLTAAGSWGAIFLRWDFLDYGGHYGTEIWRNNVNVLSSASMIAVATGRTYTDYVGEKTDHYYWVRNRNIDDVVGGYNSSSGVLGTSNLITTAEDFVLANPDAAYVPFTIVNYGDDTNPDWKMLLNGQVIITSDLSIGQLITGEMRPNTRFTVGNGSIELGTDSGGLGFLQVSGDGGITGNDYLYLNAGELNMFVYDPNKGEHVRYKQLRRIERGTVTTDGTVEVTIPPYFKSEPYVQLSIQDIGVYNPNYSNQSQSLQVSVGPITPVSGVQGSYKFTPTAQLFLADGVQTKAENLDSGTLTNVDTWQADGASTYVNAKQFSVEFTIQSQKRLDSSHWQNRQVTIILQGSLNGGAYTDLTSSTFDIPGDNTPSTITLDSGVQTQGDWDLRFKFAAADRSGSTPAPGQDYDYYEDLNVTSGDEFTIVNDANSAAGDYYEQLIQSNRPSVAAGWVLYAIDFKVNFTRKAEAWRICYADCNDPLPSILQGTATAVIPGRNNLEIVGNIGTHNSPLCNQYLSVSDPSYRVTNDSGVAGTGGKINISDNAEPYISGRFSNTPASVSGDNAQNSQAPSCFYGASKAEVVISGYDVSYYYRKPKPQDYNTYNKFHVGTVTADLGATAIPVGDATINWIAVGE